MTKVKSKSAGRPRRSDSNVDLKALGLRIRQLRGQTNQEDFAKALGISQAQLSKYELGKRSPPRSISCPGKVARDQRRLDPDREKIERVRLNEPLLPAGSPSLRGFDDSVQIGHALAIPGMAFARETSCNRPIRTGSRSKT